MLATLGGLLFVVFAFSSPAPLADPAAEFEKEFARGRDLAARGKWADAIESLRTTLARHENAGYVLARRAEIVEEWKRASFRSAWKAPDPKTLVSGELLSFSPSSGNVKIAYPRGMRGDFITESVANSEPGPARKIWRHPLQFRGPYAIEGRLESPNAPGPVQVLVALEGERAHSISLGGKSAAGRGPQRYFEAGIVRLDGKERETLASVPGVSELSGEPYRISVTYDGISCSRGGKKFLQSKKPAGLYGGFAFAGTGDVFSELTIEGKCDPAWMKGLADAAETRAYAEFEKTFDAAKELPEWLAGGESAAAPVTVRELVPVELTDEQRRLAGPIFTSILAEKFDDARTGLAAIPKGAVPAPHLDWLEALLLEGRGERRAALESLDRTLAAAPLFLAGRLKRAAILEELARAAEAIAESESIVADFPADAESYVRLARLHLAAGRQAEAKAAIERALAAGVKSPVVDGGAELLAKAANGPRWTKPVELKSKHYRVVTDMDFKTALEASKILEDAYFSYTHRLKRPADAESKRFPVYLFSSRAGYEAYAKGIGAAMSNTAGVYSVALQQLLIWNLPDRALFADTIRHEGFHQYFDRVADRPPVWLDEGLAEYFESAGIEDGKWTEGHGNAAHVARVLAERFPIEAFLRIDREKFYRNATDNYARAWALVHFLRRSGAEREKIFDTLFEKLCAGAPNDEAIDAAFAGADFASLERDFLLHVRGIRN